ncbi:hypothetical protein PLANPX_5220 [Lacipirellula parvula]|uniref:Uncharacterized protein n=1 Tax=Lacipirellula parvula TaxID=2650471 RepID=A0A5K7XGM8_9BACT|nr:hypothetical protein PLANPX_5220 [Lacipirellula parvula]
MSTLISHGCARRCEAFLLIGSGERFSIAEVIASPLALWIFEAA